MNCHFISRLTLNFESFSYWGKLQPGNGLLFHFSTLVAELRRAERHTFRSREFLHVLAEPDGEPCISWHDSRARRVSCHDDGVNQTWRPEPCRLGQQKGSHQLNDIGYSYQLTAVKRGTRWPVSHDHIRPRSRARLRPKKIHRSTWLNLCIFAIWYGRSTSRSVDSCQNKVSQYHMTILSGLECRAHRGRVFFF